MLELDLFLANLCLLQQEMVVEVVAKGMRWGGRQRQVRRRWVDQIRQGGKMLEDQTLEMVSRLRDLCQVSGPQKLAAIRAAGAL